MVGITDPRKQNDPIDCEITPRRAENWTTIIHKPVPVDASWPPLERLDHRDRFGRSISNLTIGRQIHSGRTWKDIVLVGGLALLQFSPVRPAQTAFALLILFGGIIIRIGNDAWDELSVGTIKATFWLFRFKVLKSSVCLLAPGRLIQGNVFRIFLFKNK